MFVEKAEAVKVSLVFLYLSDNDNEWSKGADKGIVSLFMFTKPDQKMR